MSLLSYVLLHGCLTKTPGVQEAEGHALSPSAGGAAGAAGPWHSSGGDTDSRPQECGAGLVETDACTVYRSGAHRRGARVIHSRADENDDHSLQQQQQHGGSSEERRPKQPLQPRSVKSAPSGSYAFGVRDADRSDAKTVTLKGAWMKGYLRAVGIPPPSAGNLPQSQHRKQAGEGMKEEPQKEGGRDGDRELDPPSPPPPPPAVRTQQDRPHQQINIKEQADAQKHATMRALAERAAREAESMYQTGQGLQEWAARSLDAMSDALYAVQLQSEAESAALANVGSYQKALWWMERALKLEDSDVPGRVRDPPAVTRLSLAHRAGSLAVKAGNYDRAMVLFEMALEQDMSLPRGSWQRVAMAASRGETVDAVRDLSERLFFTCNPGIRINEKVDVSNDPTQKNKTSTRTCIHTHTHTSTRTAHI